MSHTYFQKQQSVLSAVKTFEKKVRPFLDDAARDHLVDALRVDKVGGRVPEVQVKTTRKTPPAGQE